MCRVLSVKAHKVENASFANIKIDDNLVITKMLNF